MYAYPTHHRLDAGSSRRNTDTPSPLMSNSDALRPPPRPRLPSVELPDIPPTAMLYDGNYSPDLGPPLYEQVMIERLRDEQYQRSRPSSIDAHGHLGLGFDAETRAPRYPTLSPPTGFVPASQAPGRFSAIHDYHSNSAQSPLGHASQSRTGPSQTHNAAPAHHTAPPRAATPMPLSSPFVLGSGRHARHTQTLCRLATQNQSPSATQTQSCIASGSSTAHCHTSVQRTLFPQRASHDNQPVASGSSAHRQHLNGANPAPVPSSRQEPAAAAAKRDRDTSPEHTSTTSRRVRQRQSHAEAAASLAEAAAKMAEAAAQMAAAGRRFSGAARPDVESAAMGPTAIRRQEAVGEPVNAVGIPDMGSEDLHGSNSLSSTANIIQARPEEYADAIVALAEHLGIRQETYTSNPMMVFQIAMRGHRAGQRAIEAQPRAWSPSNEAGPSNARRQNTRTTAVSPKARGGPPHDGPEFRAARLESTITT